MSSVVTAPDGKEGVGRVESHGRYELLRNGQEGMKADVYENEDVLKMGMRMRRRMRMSENEDEDEGPERCIRPEVRTSLRFELASLPLPPSNPYHHTRWDEIFRKKGKGCRGEEEGTFSAEQKTS